MRISARADYALRALVEMTAAGAPMSTDSVARAQDIPSAYMGEIMSSLRRASLVVRTPSGFLVRSPESTTVADVLRAVDGPLLIIRDEFPEDLVYHGEAKQLQLLWVAARAAIRSILESVTVAQIVNNEVPDSVLAWTQDPDVWPTRRPQVLRDP